MTIDLVVTSIVVGDLDCNGVVGDSADIQVMLYHILGMSTAGQTCHSAAADFLTACDANGDNTCDLLDALMLLECDSGNNNAFCPVLARAAAAQGLSVDADPMTVYLQSAT